jgi:Fe2+ transport system protein FeoA
MNDRPLSALRTGDRATVARVDGSGPVRRRLLELGLTPGTEVTLVRRAPLRDPLTIQVRGYQLCVRRSEAETVSVRSVEPATPHGDPVKTAQGAGHRVQGSNAVLTEPCTVSRVPSLTGSPWLSTLLSPFRAFHHRSRRP